MAIYHLHCRIIGRASGRHIIAAAAYRAGQRLVDVRTGKAHDFSRKMGVVFSAVLVPRGAPAWAQDRALLWNAVEARERRKDAQLARDLTLALPVELTPAGRIRLLRDFVEHQFVRHGMVADVNLHEDHPGNPHAHVLLTLRSLGATGFGPKCRLWNERSWLMQWRHEWAVASNVALARAGEAQRIDARNYRAQGVPLEPTIKLGAAAAASGPADPRTLPARRAEHDRIRRRNGAAILARPAAALRALTQGEATFTTAQLERFLLSKTADAGQFRACRKAVLEDAELLLLRRDAAGRAHMSSREMVRTECDLFALADGLSQHDDARRKGGRRLQGAGATGLSAGQRLALDYLVHSRRRLLLLEGYAGSGKGHTLAAAHRIWLEQGHRVWGAALSGRAAEGLARGTGMAARSLAAWEHAWRQKTAQLSARDILVVDEAAMVGTRQLERVLRAAAGARATVVLVGDAQQLQAIDAGAPFRALAERLGHHTLDEVRRQQTDWQRAATRELAQGRTWAALQRYRRADCLRGHGTTAQAQAGLLAAWLKDVQLHPEGSRLLLAHRRRDVLSLNLGARALLIAGGQLRGGRAVTVQAGDRWMAAGERIVFLRNDARLGVRNGTSGVIAAVSRQALEVLVDGTTGGSSPPRRLKVPLDVYPHVDYGYAATVHRAQGMTVDRTFAYASPGWDRHATYVALTRHRVAAHLAWSKGDFRYGLGALMQRLSRSGRKDMAFDHLLAARPQATTDKGRPDPVWAHLGSLPWCDRAPAVAHAEAAARAVQREAPVQGALRGAEAFIDNVPEVRHARLALETARAQASDLQRLGKQHRAAYPWRALLGWSEPRGAFIREGRAQTYGEARQHDARQVAVAERVLQLWRAHPTTFAQAQDLAQAAETRRAAEAQRMVKARRMVQDPSGRAQQYTRVMLAMVEAVRQVHRAVAYTLDIGHSRDDRLGR